MIKELETIHGKYAEYVLKLGVNLLFLVHQRKYHLVQAEIAISLEACMLNLCAC